MRADTIVGWHTLGFWFLEYYSDKFSILPKYKKWVNKVPFRKIELIHILDIHVYTRSVTVAVKKIAKGGTMITVVTGEGWEAAKLFLRGWWGLAEFEALQH